MKDAVVQWVNCLRNNIFVNSPPLPLLYEISGALHLAHGRQAGRQNTGEFHVGRNIRLVGSFNQGTASLQPYQCIPVGFFG